MMPVPLPPEPPGFDATVRREGLAHLREQGQDPEQSPPSRALFNMRRTMADGRTRSCSYWQLAREDLRQAYSNRCVYSCFLIEQETLATGEVVSMHSIDHFSPIRTSPARLAFEWNNLRWAWRLIDNHKGSTPIPADHDPTRLAAEALLLQEDADGVLLVVPNPALPAAEQARLRHTVASLGLNQSAVALARTACFQDFIAYGHIYGHDYMRERQPFVHNFLFPAALA